MGFLIDEDLPRSTARALRKAGYNATDVRDVGLRGRSDQEVFAYAQERGDILVTADKDFASLVTFPPRSHAGIIVLRVPNELPTQEINHLLLQALAALEGDDLAGALVIVQTRRVRIRRTPPLGG